MRWLPLVLLVGCAQPGESYPPLPVSDVGAEAVDVEVPDAGAADAVAGVDDVPIQADPGPPSADLAGEDVVAVEEVEAPDGEDPPDVGPDAQECPLCATDDDCTDNRTCTDYGADGMFCGESCEAFGCAEGAEAVQSPCFSESEHGVCEGSRSCLGGTLTSCSASLPRAEECNGEDDDCDGVADEDFDDNDQDGFADCWDPDDDDDGVLDDVDNCPLTANETQADLDGDGQGDACDPDRDGDGVVNAIDCAPDDPDQSAPQNEECNGKDDDCDGQTDEQDSIGCTFYYPDKDQDSFGAQGQPTCLCSPQPGLDATNDEDCNDDNPFIAPPALEACDGFDNNCNGEVDEEGAGGCAFYYYDGDGDGWYPEFAAALCLCQGDPSIQYTGEQEGDCDDADPTAHPTAVEVCDGADDSCDGFVDEGCDDDGDQYCDSALTWEPSGFATCPQGPGDCDDLDQEVHPGAIEICNGKDDDCDPSGDLPEGTTAACGPDCTPCPPAPDGAQNVCTGAGPGGECALACPLGTFCPDCTCDASSPFAAGDSIADGQVLYDSVLDTFRIAYFVAGSFRLRAFTPQGQLGNDVLSVSNVSKWTSWGVTQVASTGDFAFAWTGYPDSAIRVGFAAMDGTAKDQVVVVPDLAGTLQRKNTRVGWHAGTNTMLAVWDETTALDRDVRGIQMDALGNAISPTFQVGGGSGDQLGPVLTSRGDGYVLAYASEGGATPEVVIRTMDHSGGGGTVFVVGTPAKAATSPTMWFEPSQNRGVVQWLDPANQYRQQMFDDQQSVGGPFGLGLSVGAVFAAPQSNKTRVVYASGGAVRRRNVDPGTGTVAAPETIVSEGIATKVIGGVSHPNGHGVVFWNETSGAAMGRLIEP